MSMLARDEPVPAAAARPVVGGRATAEPMRDAIVFADRVSALVWEVYLERRSIDQLASWVSEEVYRSLAKRLALARNAAERGGEASASLPARQQDFTVVLGPHRSRAQLDGVVEHCGVAIVNGRPRAFAMTVRLLPGGPCATALAIL